MRTLSLCAAPILLLVCCLAGHGHGSDVHQGGYGPSYDYYDLAQLDKFIDTTVAEKVQLAKRVQMVKMQKAYLLKRLDKILYGTIPAFEKIQGGQDSKLQTSLMKIKALLHIVGTLESILAGERVVTGKVNDLMVDRWSRIQELTKDNQEQDALLDKTEFFLSAAATKLLGKLAAMKEDSLGQITELKYNTKALGDLVDLRQCQSRVVEVKIDPKTHNGDVKVPMKTKNVPTVYCSLCGFNSHLYVDSSHSYGYEDMYQNNAVTVDCKASPGGLEISAIDSSKGSGNSVASVIVSVKSCTLGPQATLWG
ncbi:uncharacterized protein LOC143290879 [Babylonia areolata]|uniref:uncharacterized protein LOC143290879 n=1 Tax=Babylonia areolata TaxID=304850 RepID=UPI003FD1A759